MDVGSIGHIRSGAATSDAIRAVSQYVYTDTVTCLAGSPHLSVSMRNCGASSIAIDCREADTSPCGGTGRRRRVARCRSISRTEEYQAAGGALCPVAPVAP